jgi:rhodanese-related sulfurtransferase
MTGLTGEQVRALLQARREIALVDVREEDPFAQAHPLWAAQIAASRLELEAPWRLPRRDVTVVVCDDGEGLAAPAARRLRELGWTDVQLLDGGLAGWQAGGGEVFRDVNVPSKAFGELVEHDAGTPSLPAEAVKALLDSGEDMVVLDARRFDEYSTMSIPRGVSVPGAELLLRARDLAPDPKTRIIVNCAGRTRSLIGAQTLVNGGLPNPVAALRNGTIGWLLAGQTLEHGRMQRFGPTSEAARAEARHSAQRLAQRAGAQRIDSAQLAAWAADPTRTLYRWDVRTPEEYEAGHLPGFGSAPGGQLVQETDVFCAVRGARVVLADGFDADAGVRAPVTAHWLAQMGWDVAWLDAAVPAAHTGRGAWQPPRLAAPDVPRLTADTLAPLLADPGTVLLDVSTSRAYEQRHLPQAWWLLRSQLPAALAALAAVPVPARRFVVTCGSAALAPWAAADLQRLTSLPVSVLEGGNAAWFAQGGAGAAGFERALSPRIDRYRRPYEGTSAPREAMQAYLDWEFGLVAQLGRDDTHGFRVLKPQ